MRSGRQAYMPYFPYSVWSNIGLLTIQVLIHQQHNILTTYSGTAVIHISYKVSKAFSDGILFQTAGYRKRSFALEEFCCRLDPGYKMIQAKRFSNRFHSQATIQLSNWPGDEKHRKCNGIKASMPRQNKQHFTDGIFKCIFVTENAWISLQISLKSASIVRITYISGLFG